jgi:ornithine decarboxylase
MSITLGARSRRLARRVVRGPQIVPQAAPSQGVMPHAVPIDVDNVTTQLLTLRRELPGVRIHVATTSLPHPAVIRAVDAFGASFAVASRGEIDLLEREGVAIGRCLHSHPVKTIADITGAYLRGIRTFVVDNTAEVAKFSELPDVAVLVRLSLPSRDERSDLSKVGVAPDGAAALVAHCLRAGLRVAGFTLHLDSRTVPAQRWVRAIRRTLALMRRLERAHGIRFDTLDLGGGFPVAYDEPVPEFAELARGIRSAIADAPPRYRILVESGQFDIAS